LRFSVLLVPTVNMLELFSRQIFLFSRKPDHDVTLPFYIVFLSTPQLADNPSSETGVEVFLIEVYWTRNKTSQSTGRCSLCLALGIDERRWIHQYFMKHGVLDIKVVEFKMKQYRTLLANALKTRSNRQLLIQIPHLHKIPSNDCFWFLMWLWHFWW
jgi:hypothetical protein